MSNYMEKVAEMLGVKLGERFKINGEKYYITKEGLFDDDDDLCTMIFMHLITGAYPIEKLPWKPQNGDDYFVGTMGCSASINSWRGDYFDYALYYTGNCFRTREEALTHAPEITEKMRKKYEEE